MDNVLTKRETEILKAVVRNYISNAEPVSSKLLCEKSNLNLSSSSIRLVLNKLEKKGFIMQPHTSAGRVPTDLGYRYYIQYTMDSTKLPSELFEKIKKRLYEKRSSFEKLLDEVVYIVSELSSQVAFGVTPVPFNSTLSNLDAIKVGDRHYLLIFSFSNQITKTIQLRLSQSVSPIDMENTIKTLRNILCGKKLSMIRENFWQLIQNSFYLDNKIIEYINENKEQLFDFSNPEKLILHGAGNVVSKPEFSDKSSLVSILQCYDRADEMKKMITENLNFDGVSIFFGAEGSVDYYREFTFVSAPYEYYDSRGIIGVMGPKRMRYSHIIPALNSIRDILIQFLDE